MSELLEVADELYGLAPERFTPERDARAKQLKGTDLAAPVKALKKPSVAAWVVNQLVRHETEQVEQLLAVGEAVRAAAASLEASQLRELTKQRRQLTAAVTTQARKVAGGLGVKVTQAVADQVEATLTAAMLDEACARAVRSGLLVAALSTTGVGDTDPSPALAVPEALGFAATSAPEADTGPALRAVPDPDPDETARLRAEEALARAEEALTSAEEAVASAQASVDELEARSLQVQAEIDELKRRLADLESRQEDVDDELSDAEDELAEATSARDEALSTRDAAAAALR